ncbi:MAG: putative DNA-binding domain-containing protein [Bdellovibrionales bacterium]|nr:putative DNA-binding domain-containing protein [Bdellovibrionales bacterium]
MKSLVELQIAFQKAVRDRNASAELIRLVREQPPLSTRERLHVYQEAYEVRLKESLRDDFGRVRAQLSFEQFEGLISSFISAHPQLLGTSLNTAKGFVDFNAQECVIALPRSA